MCGSGKRGSAGRAQRALGCDAAAEPPAAGTHASREARVSDATKDYLDNLEQALKLGNATEHTHRPALKAFLEGLRPGVVAINEPKRSACGAPDYEVVTTSGATSLRLGHAEAKDIGASLNGAQRSAQLKRYREALPNLILTDYLEFRWYVQGELVRSARLATADPQGRLTPVEGGDTAVVGLLQDFLQQQPEPITEALVLAQRMAALTKLLHDVVLASLRTQDNASPIVGELWTAFEEVLIPDLGADQFADMFAQTVAYGLFAARMRHDETTGPFEREQAAREIPRTNPFLRRLFGTVSGPDLDDEPYVGIVDDLTQLLNVTDTTAVMSGFGSASGRGDPVFHFYETFLAAYDPSVRERRGVYYTPDAVVDFIVKSVDKLLVRDFGVEAGLADTERHSDGSHRVLVLDPAVGTGTFLYDVIGHIRERFRDRGLAGMWSQYVRDHLLPRLFGFELMMAPYAVAHLKLGLQLAGEDLPSADRATWEYDFSSEDRLGVYLTNSLQESAPASQVVLGGYLTDEANAAARVKTELPIMVVMGNPPYSGHSANRSTKLMLVQGGTTYPVREGGRWTGARVAAETAEIVGPTFIGRLLDDYYHVDGQPLGERNPKWLQDDYVKFIRFGQWRIEQTGAGILAFITNHAYMDNSTFRGMRQELLSVFDEIYLVDLHGNQRKRETPPNGGVDENVFDILQGVAIALFVKRPGAETGCRVYHHDRWGTRAAKYEWLHANDVESVAWTQLDVTPGEYTFKPLGADVATEWDAGWDVTEIFPVSSVGIATHRDLLSVSFNATEAEEKFRQFTDPNVADATVRARFWGTSQTGEYPPGDKATWRLTDQRRALREAGDWAGDIVLYQYRPFDYRYLMDRPEVVDRPRTATMKHFRRGENLGLAVGRAGQAVRAGSWNLAWVSAAPTDLNLFYRGGNQLAPLYLYPDPVEADDGGWSQTFAQADGPAGEGGRRPNLAPDFLAALAGQLDREFVVESCSAPQGTFGPFEVLAYVYAILWCPSWRSRFAEYLDTRPPRVPLPPDAAFFDDIVAAGRDLVRLHTEGAPTTYVNGITFPVSGDNTVQSSHPVYVAPGECPLGSSEVLTEGRVYIAPAPHGQYFGGVSPDVWSFEVGGYQVCDKWLRDRQGRELSFDELESYRGVVGSIISTLEVVERIEDAIPGWPIP